LQRFPPAPHKNPIYSVSVLYGRGSELETQFIPVRALDIGTQQN
jgi:hypothetical protein